MKVTKKQLLEMLESLGASSEEAVLEFFHGSVHYAAAAGEGVVGVLQQSHGIHPSGVYVQVVSA